MFRTLIVLVLVISLCGCASFRRSDEAAEAKRKMRGMTKEQVLICMGPPKQKAHVGDTEVWSYNSTNGLSSSYGFAYTMRDKSSCTVNVVMSKDIVAAVHYNGPAGGWFDADEQCAYAIHNCVDGD